MDHRGFGRPDLPLRQTAVQGGIVDPKSQTEDLGDDAVKASEYGIRNLRYILENLDTWLASGDDDYSQRNGMYTNIVNQYVTYIQHVYANIGGIYLNEKLEGDPWRPWRASRARNSAGHCSSSSRNSNGWSGSTTRLCWKR